MLGLGNLSIHGFWDMSLYGLQIVIRHIVNVVVSLFQRLHYRAVMSF